VDDVLRDLGLAEDAGKKVGVLSGGQRKRVNMAPELLARPSLLVLDEPTSGLDPNLDQSVMQQLHSLAHRGMTIIVVTHNVMHLEECDQLLVMAPEGRLAFLRAARGRPWLLPRGQLDLPRWLLADLTLRRCVPSWHASTPTCCAGCARNTTGCGHDPRHKTRGTGP
jgi:energy-coupling factor transporter ATP-binding protein EcfA2